MTDFIIIIEFEINFKGSNKTNFLKCEDKTLSEYHETLLGNKISKAAQKHPRGSSGISII